MKKKIVLLTGASSGIGKDIALTLLKRGYLVYGAARRVEMMRDLETLGGKILALDVSEQKSCDHAIQTIIKEEGQIDILINNAGYGNFGSIEDVPLDEARRQFDVNVFGAAYLMQKVIPYMKTNKSGYIINISSVVGRTTLPVMGWYCASKHALEALSDAARMELKHFGIKVILIEPGVVESEFKQIAVQNVNLSEDYQHIAENMLKYQEKRNPAPASTVSKCVVQAIESAKPKARYIPNTDSLLGQAAYRLVGDRVYDRVVMSILGKRKKK